MAKRNRKRVADRGGVSMPAPVFELPASTRAWADRSALAVFALFTLAVIAYAALGNTWVDSLDEKVGEVLAHRGDRMAERGRTKDAAELFREALTARFDDPNQRLWTHHNLADAYIQLEQYDEAARIARAAIPLSGDNGRAYGQYQRAAWLAEDFSAALEASNAMRGWAQKYHRKEDEARAEFLRGSAQRRLGQTDDAIESFVRSFELVSAADSGWGAATLLSELGRPKEALPYLETVIQKAAGPRKQEAIKLRESIRRNAGA